MGQQITVLQPKIPAPSLGVVRGATVLQERIAAMHPPKRKQPKQKQRKMVIIVVWADTVSQEPHEVVKRGILDRINDALGMDFEVSERTVQQTKKEKS